MTVNLGDIEQAAAAIGDHVLRTPLLHSPRLSERTGAEISLKLEGLQYTGSFKERGALNKLLSLDRGALSRGVIASSAGNHAQGVAFHAQRLEIPTTIVMPRPTAFIKVERTEALGAQVILHGESLAEAMAHARKLAERDSLTFVHPYDDEQIIAGQGTIALEMLADHPTLEVLVVPVGGGGLISGIAIAAKALRPDICILGVQAELCPSLYAAQRGESMEMRNDTIADRIAVKEPGSLTFPYVKEFVDDLVLVDERSLELAVEMLISDQKLIVEGAGAAALAAMLAHPKDLAGKRVGLVVSGGNIDARLLSTLMLRGLRREGRIVRLRIEISDTPGILARVSTLIGESGANIIEVQHHRMMSDVPAKLAELDVLVETHGRTHGQRLLDTLQREGFPAEIS